MKKRFLLFLVMMETIFLTAQTNQISVGANYINQTYYNIDDGSTVQHDNSSWDIAFATGENELGIFVNEGVAASFTEPLAEVELYLSSSTDFSTVDTTGMTRIYNDEVNWSEGAFNHVKEITDPLDMGWGTYEEINQQVNGTRVFVIKLRNEVYKKLKILSLIDGIYTFRYADLDGSNENTKTLSKADYEGKTLAYFSLETGDSFDFEPDGWDLLFTRYSTPLDDGSGGFLDYIVTGVLSNAGVEVAQADGIDPITVVHTDYEDSYMDSLTAIGHDWKYFDLGELQWIVPLDRVYFIKTLDNKIWKILFVDFEGSSTGVTTLEKQLEADITNLEGVFENLGSFEVFPNPATDLINIAFEIKTSAPKSQLQISNNLGQMIYTQEIQTRNGLNVQTIPLNMASGFYYLTLIAGNDFITKPLMVK